MKVFLIISFLIIGTAKIFAQTGGESVYTFLQLPVCGNSAAMGGAVVSGGNLGANHLFGNAAMIDTLHDRYASLNYADYIADINFGTAAYCAKIDSLWSVAGGVQFMSYGSFDYADEAGVLGGTFTAKDHAIYVAGIRQITKRLRASVTLKTIFSHLETYKSWGMAFDLGLAYNIEEQGIVIGATVRNLGWQCRPYTGGHREPLPLDIQLGASKMLLHAPLRFSLTCTNLQSRLDSSFMTNVADHLVFGVELFPKSVVSAKAGFNVLRHNDLSVSGATPFAGFSIGADVRLRRFAVQYSRVCYGAAASINMFTAELFLREFR
ncbi:MAG: type IX secretion system protein PorQ [Bacteroidales bacterium]|nr:type IX secretion system protein PorQ [Bacteroidales bacterium]